MKTITNSLQTIIKKSLLPGITAALLSFNLASFAQNSQQWSLYQDLEDVKIEQKISQCQYQGSDDASEYTFLKLTNKTQSELFVTFKIEIFYNGSCTTCSNDEYLFTFHLMPGQSMEPDCSFKNDENGHLAIYMRQVKNPSKTSVFTKFQLSNINVQKK